MAVLVKLNDMTYNELRACAKSLGLTLRSPTRDQLLAAIKRAQAQDLQLMKLVSTIKAERDLEQAHSSFAAVFMGYTT